MISKTVEVVIVGAGPIGASLMLSLKGLGLSVLLVDKNPLGPKIHTDFDARSLALSPSSQRILNGLGVWSDLEQFITPIETIHISEQSRFGVSRLQDPKLQPLGYMVQMQHINQVLHGLLNQDEMLIGEVTTIDLAQKELVVQTASGAYRLQARLLVAADGSQSKIRTLCDLELKTKEYNQCAIVANIGLACPHRNQAFERFTHKGPLALLPLHAQRMALVWAVSPDSAQSLLALDDCAFLKTLQQVFGYRLGRLLKVGTRTSYKLQQMIMPKFVQDHVVFIGNAAHTLHPVAGQGFNLGLRDVAFLAQCIAEFGLSEITLTQYVRLRIGDQQVMSRFTDGLINLFASRMPGLGAARGIGLVLFDTMPWMKNILSRYARGFGGTVPNLACNIPLDEHLNEL